MDTPPQNRAVYFTPSPALMVGPETSGTCSMPASVRLPSASGTAGDYASWSMDDPGKGSRQNGSVTLRDKDLALEASVVRPLVKWLRCRDYHWARSLCWSRDMDLVRGHPP